MAGTHDSFSMNRWRPWAELPTKILELIFKKLSICDRVHLSGVCKAWRSSCVIKLPRHALKSPWLVLPTKPSHGTYSLLNPMNSKTLDLNLSIPKSQCFGHSMGWLIIYDEVEGYYLLNPLNFQRLQLPYPNEDNDLHKNFFVLATICDAPYSIVVAARAEKGGLYLCRPEDREWVILQEEFSGTFTFSNGCLHCLDLRSRQQTTITRYFFDPDAQLCESKNVELPEICASNRTLLVESSSGDLLLVVAEGDEETTGFHVFKLNNVYWEAIERLPHDDILFITYGGACCAKSSTSSNPLGYQSNSIYFTDILSGIPLLADRSEFDHGKLSLKDGLMTQWILPDSYPLQTVPFWFFPKV